MARRNKAARPPSLSAADFSESKPMKPEAVAELISKALVKMTSAETWQAGISELLKTAKSVAKKFGGLPGGI